MRNELLEAHRSGKLMLFAGAGVSANLGLPNWSQLIGQIAKELGYDPVVFETYGNYQVLAEFYRKKRGGLGELRSWMDREWHKPSTDIKASDIHRFICHGNFSRIYTTNYDRWLEMAHDKFGVKYDRIASVADMVAVRDGHRQIIKFHGDFAADESIVLDETSYYQRLSFDTPLDIKLRNDVLSNSVLFIGYSLTDFNIRLLFYRLTEMWRESPLATARPKSYVFTHRPNPAAEEVLRHWGIEMIVSDEDDPKTALTGFLEKLVS
ncbi:SIR2 family protein [Stenotrophomonas maltophilia]|uniref:SIR2 family protein n=2 Tax=Gammaproteobacteria TaxID=1236 RepID=UPI00066EF4A2|nr:SIR2 family protein [Stenotrophomonas maltophilia]MBA0289825.1 Sir2 family NAD-dependent protein deacetylase [Stenotrophomonas maltophilia]MBA0375981.1 Sir2 family NAD-dependent protein deacetylase [Stenotrophomonas maltophilia]MBA0545510.1 Sir2 family NAD-dependent protein deacetylase [Stenotrophomonas maltophilia]MBH1677188.1 SIR2 family protein [Stenotrophomonas maltophilia]MCF3537657.1 Sir2 family NAD-dependent protein deacetylase [Stenotrophomonas maltophilia]